MTNNEDYNKEVLQCRSCKSVFHQMDVKLVETERCGLKIIERVCPVCGSRTYGYIDYPIDEFDLIYKSNIPSELRLHMDRLVESILKEDKFVREVNQERMAMA